MRQLVFVFGTLKEGFPNFATNKGVRLPGVFKTVERYPFYLVGERHSPWLIDNPGEGKRIAGQLFEVDQIALEAMDTLERITEPDGYRRTTVQVESQEAGSFRVVTCFAYLRQRRHYVASEVRLGPLDEYTLEHAALYRPRA